MKYYVITEEQLKQYGIDEEDVYGYASHPYIGVSPKIIEEEMKMIKKAVYGSRLKFKSYNGRYPSLCFGNLILELDGVDIEFGSALCSGGGLDEEYESYEGDWRIPCFPTGFPEELKELAVELVNENVPKGCCGGCA